MAAETPELTRPSIPETERVETETTSNEPEPTDKLVSIMNIVQDPEADTPKRLFNAILPHNRSSSLELRGKKSAEQTVPMQPETFRGEPVEWNETKRLAAPDHNREMYLVKKRNPENPTGWDIMMVYGGNEQVKNQTRVELVPSYQRANAEAAKRGEPLVDKIAQYPVKDTVAVKQRLTRIDGEPLDVFAYYELGAIPEIPEGVSQEYYLEHHIPNYPGEQEVKGHQIELERQHALAQVREGIAKEEPTELDLERARRRRELNERLEKREMPEVKLERENALQKRTIERIEKINKEKSNKKDSAEEADRQERLNWQLSILKGTEESIAQLQEQLGIQPTNQQPEEANTPQASTENTSFASEPEQRQQPNNTVSRTPSSSTPRIASPGEPSTSPFNRRARIQGQIRAGLRPETPQGIKTPTNLINPSAPPVVETATVTPNPADTTAERLEEATPPVEDRLTERNRLIGEWEQANPEPGPNATQRERAEYETRRDRYYKDTIYPFLNEKYGDPFAPKPETPSANEKPTDAEKNKKRVEATNRAFKEKKKSTWKSWVAIGIIGLTLGLSGDRGSSRSSESTGIHTGNATTGREGIASGDATGGLRNVDGNPPIEATPIESYVVQPGDSYTSIFDKNLPPNTVAPEDREVFDTIGKNVLVALNGQEADSNGQHYLAVGQKIEPLSSQEEALLYQLWKSGDKSPFPWDIAAKKALEDLRGLQAKEDEGKKSDRRVAEDVRAIKEALREHGLGDALVNK